MLKLKLIAISGIFILVGIVLNSSHQFSSSARTDVILDEIANYKKWTKITKKPIAVGIGNRTIGM